MPFTTPNGTRRQNRTILRGAALIVMIVSLVVGLASLAPGRAEASAGTQGRAICNEGGSTPTNFIQVDADVKDWLHDTYARVWRLTNEGWVWVGDWQESNNYSIAPGGGFWYSVQLWTKPWGGGQWTEVGVVHITPGLYNSGGSCYLYQY